MSDNKAPELQPCPLCKSKRIEKAAMVRCKDCGCRAPLRSWNTRTAAVATPREVVEEFRRQIVAHCRGLEKEYNWKLAGEVAGDIAYFVETLPLPTCGAASVSQPDNSAVVAMRALWREAILIVDTAPLCHCAGKEYVDPIALVQRMNAALESVELPKEEGE